MIINFFHIPKTGGISIKNAVTKHGEVLNRTTWKLPNGNKFRYFAHYVPCEHLEHHITEDSVSFSFVRNPWDRFVSAYFYLRQGGMTQRDRYDCKMLQLDAGGFHDFLNRFNINPHRYLQQQHFKEQIFWTRYNGKQFIDIIGKTEQMDEDIKQLNEYLGIEIEVPKLNRSYHRPYTDYFITDEHKKVIERVYGEDIKQFNYTFE